MKKVTVLYLASFILLATSLSVNAQEDPRPYNPVADRLARAISSELPDWRRRSVPPINRDAPDTFSNELIIDQWSSKEGNVKVVVFLHSSETDAKREFEKFTVGVKANERLRDVDDEAFAWGINKSVAFRRGSYAVYISSIAYDARSGDGDSDKRPNQEAKLSKMFARIVAKALKEQ